MSAGETRAVPERLEYKPALDGLRALAVLSVILFHSLGSSGVARGGFLGVDIFFVLSGFLITSLLLIDHANKGRVVSLGFWARRARRLLPALLVLLAMQTLFAFFRAKPWELHTIRDGSAAALLYVTNFWELSGHHATKNYLLGHTWSLAIEEQFYLVWPVLLAGILYVARGSKAWLVGFIAALAMTSALAMAWMYSPARPDRAYQATQARASSLLVGAVLGILLLGWRGPVRRGARMALEVAGIAALVFLIVLVLRVDLDNAPWLFHGGFQVVAVVTAVLIAAATQSSSPVLGRALSIKPLVWLGLISYGLYLFHIPIFTLLNATRLGVHGVPLLLIRLAIVIPIAAASYFVIEMPVRRGALTRTRLNFVVPTVAAAIVLCLVVETVGSKPITPQIQARIAYQRIADAVPKTSTKVLVAGNGALVFSLAGRPGGLFFGEDVVGVTASVYGCSIVSGTEVETQRAACTDWPNVYRDAVDAYEPDVSVLAISASEVFDRVEHGRKLAVATPAFESYMLGRLEQARRVLTRHGTPLLLLTTPCGNDPYRAAWVNGVLRHFAAKHPDSVQIGDYAAFMCPHGVMRTSYAGKPVFDANGISLTLDGAHATWGWLAHTPLVAETVRKN